MRVIGLLGLGVIGRALAENLARQGCRVRGFDPSPEARARASAEGIKVSADLADLVQGLAPPRAVLLLVPAGRDVDAAIEALLPGLTAGDLVVDCGNSHWRDTERRSAAMAGRGLGYLGVGISGGEAGARDGPAIMAGGSAEGWTRVGPLLTAAAARFDDEPCCAWLGPGGAGHFTKMVHNGIEYAVMQLIAETFDLAVHGLGLEHDEAADLFERFGHGALGSYLIDITAEVLRLVDEPSGEPFVELINDAAEQKGTGNWASVEALEQGVPATLLMEAVAARSLSARKAAREALRREPEPGPAKGEVHAADLEAALLAGTLVAYAQGFELLATAGATHGWPLDLARVARLWRAGCIIRAKLLSPIAKALERLPEGVPLLADALLAERLEAALPGLRAALLAAAERGVPTPCLAAALAWLDAHRVARLPTRLIQAQRDHFGRHGFARIDRPGRHHLPRAEEAGP
jgi:6-phosphogluconate dehydrogenase